MSNEEAIEEFDFFNEGDYITREMSEAKDIVLKELQDVKSDLYEANNRINDLLDIVKQKNKIIIEMADYIKNPSKSVYLPQIFKVRMGKRETIIKYFEERCNDAKD